MAQAQNGDVVKVHYSGKLGDGTVFESSEGRPPLEVQLGGKRILPGVEKAVVGMSVGESKTITIAASDAYGRHRPELRVVVKRTELPDDIKPEVGQQLPFGSGGRGSQFSPSGDRRTYILVGTGFVIDRVITGRA